MNIIKSFKNLNKFDIILWVFSLIAVTLSFILSQNFNLLIIGASLIGVTALIFTAKGDVLGQILIVIFSLLYSVISFQYAYYGEVITYLGMTTPIAILSVISWLRHPFKDTNEVEVHKLTKGQKIRLVVFTILATIVFYFILKYFGTANLIISTLSITTSFSASYLTLYRNSFYATAYASNDIVLIVLWILASIENPIYIPMIICFIVFLINDIYGFICWRKMKLRQGKSK